jgi:hypothetical protein
MSLGLFEATRAQQTGATLTLDTQNVIFSNVSSGGSMSQTIHVTSSTSGNFSVDTSNSASWLRVTPNGTVNAVAGTPVPLVLTANAAGSPNLAPGTYQTSFTVSTSGNTSNPTTVMVTMMVGGVTVFTSSPSVLNFMATPGALQATPSVLPVTITSNGGSGLNYTVTAMTQSGNNWLIPYSSSGTTVAGVAQPLLVGVNPAGLAAGTYFGEITVSSLNTPDTVAIAVVLTVSNNSNSAVTPTTLQPFLYQVGSTPSSGQLSQTVTVHGTGTFSTSENPRPRAEPSECPARLAPPA